MDVNREGLENNLLKTEDDEYFENNMIVEFRYDMAVKVEENPQRILNYAQDKRCSNEIWMEST